MNYKSVAFIFCGIAVLGTITVATAKDQAANTTTVISAADVKWTPVPGAPPVSIAPVNGNPDKGPSHFYLKYAAGFVTPNHHHSSDHFVTTVSGTLVLTVGGKEHRLPPGSFFAGTKKVPHIARCEGETDCVMFIDARSKWDVVPEAAPSSKS